MTAALVVRDVQPGDAAELAVLLNAIIARGGTTALEDPFEASSLDAAYLTGPDVHCCVVAVDTATGRLEGFQTLGRKADLPAEVGDIGTFARLDSTQRGVGRALFAATLAHACELGLAHINATIRSDNVGGLAFYDKLGFETYSETPPLPLRNGTPVPRVSKLFDLKRTDVPVCDALALGKDNRHSLTSGPVQAHV